MTMPWNGPGLAAAPSPEAVNALRPHVVSLRVGRFDPGARVATVRQAVDWIFAGDLEAAREAAKAAGRPLKLLFYAHGDDGQTCSRAPCSTRWATTPATTLRCGRRGWRS